MFELKGSKKAIIAVAECGEALQKLEAEGRLPQNGNDMTSAAPGLGTQSQQPQAQMEQEAPKERESKPAPTEEPMPTYQVEL